MKLYKELTPWALILLIAVTAFFILFENTPVPSEVGENRNSSLFLAGPAFFATLALASFFLLVRFFVPHGKPAPPSHLWHVVASALLALAAVITWEFSQMFLADRSFAFSSVAGALAGCLTLLILWLFISAKMQKRNKGSNLS